MRHLSYIILLFSVVSPYTIYADITGQSIFRVRNGNVQQTGFYTIIKHGKQKREGVVTALHGLTTSSGNPSIIHKGTSYEMTITHVDIERDIAFLQFINKPSDIRLLQAYREIPKGKIQIAGYPIGFAVLKVRNAEIGSPATQKLEDYGVLDKRQWEKRNSPSLKTQVLNIDGNLLPGDSGCLIASMEGLIIAVGNGGFDSGRINIGWAIPWTSIKFTPIDKVRGEFYRLTRWETPGTLLFSETARKRNDILPCLPTDVRCWEKWVDEAIVAVKAEDTTKKCKTSVSLDKEGECLFLQGRASGNRVMSCLGGLQMLKMLNDPFYCTEKQIYMIMKAAINPEIFLLSQSNMHFILAIQPFLNQNG